MTVRARGRDHGPNGLHDELWLTCDGDHVVVAEIRDDVDAARRQACEVVLQPQPRAVEEPFETEAEPRIVLASGGAHDDGDVSEAPGRRGLCERLLHVDALLVGRILLTARS